MKSNFDLKARSKKIREFRKEYDREKDDLEYYELTKKHKELAEELAEAVDSGEIENYGLKDKLSDKVDKLFNKVGENLGIGLGSGLACIIGAGCAHYANIPELSAPLVGCGGGIYFTTAHLASHPSEEKEYDSHYFSSNKSKGIYEDLIENPERYEEYVKEL